MAKAENIKIVKLQVEAGKANPGSVGSILGQYGVNMRDFCTQFNDRSTQNEKEGTKLTVTLRIDEKRNFEMSISAPPVAEQIKAIIGCKGSGEPHINKVGKLTKRDVEAIVEKKHAELTGATRLAMAKTIAGSARSMGVELDFDLAEFEE